MLIQILLKVVIQIIILLEFFKFLQELFEFDILLLPQPLTFLHYLITHIYDATMTLSHPEKNSI